MPLLFILGIAYVINEAIWGTTEYVGDKTKPARTKFGEWLDKKVRENPLEGDSSVPRVLGWAACSLAWLAGKTIKNGPGLVKKNIESGKEGWRKAKDLYDWAKTEREIAKAVKEAQKINEEIDKKGRKVQVKRKRKLTWEDLLRARKNKERAEQEPPKAAPPPAPSAPMNDPPTQTIHTPPSSDRQPPSTPAPNFPRVPQVVTPERVDQPDRPNVEVAVLDRPSVPALIAPEFEDSTVVEAEIVPTSPGLPVLAAANGASMSTDLVHHGGAGPDFSLEGGGYEGTMQALGYFRQVTSLARERAEARARDAIQTAQEMSGHYHNLTNMIEQMIGQEVDQASLGEAVMIRDEIQNAVNHAQSSANFDYLTYESASNASVMSAQAQENLQARHGGMAAAAAEAPVEIAAKEFYQPR